MTRETELLDDIAALTKNRDDAVTDRNKHLEAKKKVQQENIELLAAAKLVLNSFGYRTGKGPEWYEACRNAVEKHNGE